MKNVKDYITIDPEILGGQAVFYGTRVTIESLFDHLENGVTLDEFLGDFPSVSKENAIAVIEIAAKIMSSKDIQKFIFEVYWKHNTLKEKEFILAVGQLIAIITGSNTQILKNIISIIPKKI